MIDHWNMRHWRRRAVARKRQIKAIPGVFKFKSLLYIGANTDRIELVDLFLKHGFEIEVLEAWKPNVEGLRELNAKQKIFYAIIHADARQLIGFPGDVYDVVMFWHGLEHLKKEEIHATVKGIEHVAKHLVNFGCPVGKYEQDAVDGNEFEKHLSFLDQSDFHWMGYQTSVVRRKKPRGSNICAWKFL